jgi:hypothetical protein
MEPMARKKQKIPPKLQPWIEAQQRYRLSDVQVQMARELGMNPKNFQKFASTRGKPWKLPLGAFIEECYRKRFRRERPKTVRPLSGEPELPPPPSRSAVSDPSQEG